MLAIPPALMVKMSRFPSPPKTGERGDIALESGFEALGVGNSNCR